MGAKIYLTDDGVGYALTPEGDMMRIFKDSGRKGAGREAIIHGIANGAKTLDCLGAVLEISTSFLVLRRWAGMPGTTSTPPMGGTMRRKEGPTSSISVTPKGSPGPRLTLEDVLGLLEVDKLPEGDMSQEWIIQTVQKGVEREGLENYKKHRLFHLEQLEYIQSM